jgi:hypothetical protein
MLESALSRSSSAGSMAGGAAGVAGSGVSDNASGNDSPGGFGMATSAFSSMLPESSSARQGSAGDGMIWKVDYTPGNHVMCRKCFAAIPDGVVRVVAQSPSVAYYHLAKQFYHLECRAPGCPVAEVQGLAALLPKDKALVEKAMAAGNSA